jgi:hypothetical protein
MDARFCEAGTTAERPQERVGNVVYTFLRAPPKRASGEVRFLLTKTYMEVGHPEIGPSGDLGSDRNAILELEAPHEQTGLPRSVPPLP